MNHVSLKDHPGYLAFGNDDVIVIDDLHDNMLPIVSISRQVLFVWCQRGKIQFDYNGQQTTLSAGCLFCGIPNGTLSDFLFSQDFQCRAFLISSAASEGLDVVQKRIFTDSLFIKTHPVARPDDVESATLDSHLRLLIHWMRQSESPYYADMVRLQASSVMLTALSVFQRENSAGIVHQEISLHGYELVKAFVRMVEDSGGRIRKVETFADRLCVTPKYLSWLVKRGLQKRPLEIISTVAMQAIEYRLRYTELTMKQIAEELDFPNSSFFGKYVKEHTGMTPVEIREKYHHGRNIDE